MKYRMGLISNSSSSSFCIYGVKTNLIELQKIFTEEFQPKQIEACEHKFNRKNNKFCSECGQPSHKQINPTAYHVAYIFDYIYKNLGYDEGIIGYKIPDNSTLEVLYKKLNIVKDHIYQKFGREPTILVGE